MQEHWAGLERRIARMGPPQVPGPELAAQVAGLCDGCHGTTVLLGVTPAYAGLGDPLLALDASSDMIAAVWPGDDARRRASVADWTALPVPDGSVAQVLGDGSLNVLPDRAVMRAVLAEVRRCLAPGGKAVIRVFLRRDPEASVDDVLQAARDGRFESLNVLRWRLAAALATGPAHEVLVSDILLAAERLGDLETFAKARQMVPEQAEHFLAYRGLGLRYVFPDRKAVVEDAGQVGLGCGWVSTKGYPGAEDCALAVLSPLR
jgi:SAM-dependent methyltransferase